MERLGQLKIPMVSSGMEPATFFYLVCEAIDTAATPGLLCQPRVIVKMIVEKQMGCRLTGETEVLGENLPPRHFYPTRNLTACSISPQPTTVLCAGPEPKYGKKKKIRHRLE
jgi:hypothetical protein